jgi:hypothetical protein
MNAVRYDSPAIAGFTASASWGEDDDWQLAVRYAGDIGGFKVLFGAGYSASTDENLTVPIAALIEKDSRYVQAGAYAEHMASGLFVHGAYGHEDNGGTVLAGGVTPPNSDHWYAKAGIRRKWIPLGATVIYGDYGRYIDQIGPAAIGLGVTSSELERFGGGALQEIDAASMSIWLKYRETRADIAGGGAIGSLDDMTAISTGALINF